MVLIWLVEDLDAEHDEAGVVASCQTNVIQVIEACAELRTDERVGRRVKFACDTVWLEAEDASRDVVNIVSPASHDRVALDGVARDACARQALLKT